MPKLEEIKDIDKIVANLDEGIEKANRLNVLLQEAQTIINSLSQDRPEQAEVSHMVLTYDSEPTSKGEAQDHIEWMLKALGI